MTLLRRQHFLHYVPTKFGFVRTTNSLMRLLLFCCTQCTKRMQRKCVQQIQQICFYWKVISLSIYYYFQAQPLHPKTTRTSSFYLHTVYFMLWPVFTGCIMTCEKHWFLPKQKVWFYADNQKASRSLQQPLCYQFASEKCWKTQISQIVGTSGQDNINDLGFLINY